MQWGKLKEARTALIVTDLDSRLALYNDLTLRFARAQRKLRDTRNKHQMGQFEARK